MKKSFILISGPNSGKKITGNLIMQVGNTVQFDEYQINGKTYNEESSTINNPFNGVFILGEDIRNLLPSEEFVPKEGIAGKAPAYLFD